MNDRNAKPWVHGASAFTAGFVATLCLHPLDVVKVRFQKLLNSTFRTVTDIVKQQGLRGLYAGVTPNLIGSGSAWGLYFLIYSRLKQHQQVDGEDLSMMSTLGTAAAAGMLVTSITNPIWLLKVRLISQPHESSVKYNSLRDAIRTIYKEEGIAGFYRGIGPAMFGVSHGAVQMLAYEQLKSVAIKYSAGHDTGLNVFHYFGLGAVAKLVASVTTYPYQVIKSRMQVRSSHFKRFDSSISVIKHMVKHEGVRGFYRGLVPATLRVIPHASVVFALYEKMRSVLSDTTL